MRGRLRTALVGSKWWGAVAALLLAVAVATATTTRPKDVTCPLCDNDFQALVVSSTNSLGGTDFDLCAHARGDAPNSYWVCVCPRCRYAAWTGSFEEAIDAKLKPALREGLASESASWLGRSQNLIPGWAKYELFLRRLEIEGADRRTRARVALLGAWVVRLESPDAVRPVQRDATLKTGWDSVGDASLERMEALPPVRDDALDWPRRAILVGAAILRETAGRDVTDDETALARLRGAWLLRYRGEFALARPALEELVERRPRGDAVRSTAEALLRGVLREESFLRRFVDLALPGLDEEGTGDERDGEQQAVTTYQAAEALRRLGRTDEAKAWYLRALAHPDLPSWVSLVACESLERAAPGVLTDERRRALQQGRLDVLLERLNDPETASSAYDSLRALGDPAAIPRVVEALASEDETVRAYAALTLKFLPDPPDAAIDALCKVLIEDFDDPEWRAADALVALGSPRARAAFLAGLDSGDQRVRDLSIEGLGMTGEAQDVARLLEVLDVYPRHERDVLAALTRLAGRSFGGLDELRTWWEQHRGESRADWTRACLARGGLTVSDSSESERIARLIDLLESEDVPTRCAAVRRLRELTGRSFGWEALTDGSDSPRVRQERRMAVTAWQRWREKR